MFAPVGTLFGARAFRESLGHPREDSRNGAPKAQAEFRRPVEGVHPERSEGEGEAPQALPVEGATLAPLIAH